MSNPIHRRSVDRFMAMADGREEVSVLASEYDALESENEALRSRLAEYATGAAMIDMLNTHDKTADLEAERALILQRAENAETALAQWEYSAKYDDVHYDALRARLAEAEALLLQVTKGGYPHGMSTLVLDIEAFLAPDSASGEGEK